MRYRYSTAKTVVKSIISMADQCCSVHVRHCSSPTNDLQCSEPLDYLHWCNVVNLTHRRYLRLRYHLCIHRHLPHHHRWCKALHYLVILLRYPHVVLCRARYQLKVPERVSDASSITRSGVVEPTVGPVGQRLVQVQVDVNLFTATFKVKIM